MRTFLFAFTQRLQFARDPLEDRGVNYLKGWVGVRVERMCVLRKGRDFGRRIEHDADPQGMSTEFVAGGSHQPLTGEGSKDCQCILMLGSDVGVQEGEEMRKKGLDGQWIWIGSLCGEMPLGWRQVDNDR